MEVLLLLLLPVLLQRQSWVDLLGTIVDQLVRMELLQVGCRPVGVLEQRQLLLGFLLAVVLEQNQICELWVLLAGLLVLESLKVGPGVLL